MNKQLRHISTAAFLEESNHPLLIWRGIIIATTILLLLIIWASLVTLKNSTMAYGTLTPEGKIHTIRHYGGGIINQVLVSNNENVKKGQVLLTFDTAALNSKLTELQTEEISLILDIERLNDYINNKTPDLKDWTNAVINSKFNTIQNKKQLKILLQNEMAHLNSQIQERANQKAVLESQIQQRTEKLKEVISQKHVLDKSVTLLSQELKTYKKLRQKQLIVQKDYLSMFREVIKVQGEQDRLASQIEQTRGSIIEAKNRLKELDSNLQQNAIKQLNEANNQLLEVRPRIENIENQLKRAQIRAPISGTITGLTIIPGNFVKSEDKILKIFPDHQNIKVVTQIKPNDINMIQIGDPVRIKILSYDYAHYGLMKGILTKISDSTYLNSKGQPYYKANIKLNSQYIGKGSNKTKLIAGMAVQADIRTGESTILKYLFSPLTNH